jgi:hypothetical protein
MENKIYFHIYSIVTINKEDNSLLSKALKESIYLNNSGVNSWFSSITFLSQKPRVN